MKQLPMPLPHALSGRTTRDTYRARLRHFASDWRSRLGFWNASLRQSLREARYVVLDTELTGLDRRSDTIISIGAVRMQGTRILMGETFHQLVDPQRALVRENVLVHRLRPADLVAQATTENALAALAEFVGDDILVGHFIELDLSFLQREFRRLWRARWRKQWIDTCQVVRWSENHSRGYDAQRAHGAAAPEYSLYALAGRMGMTVEHAHNALYDAYLTAQLWQRLIPLLNQHGAHRIGDVLDLARG